MGGLFSALFAKIAAVIEWFSALFVAIFVAIWDLFKDAVCWTLDEFLKIAVAAISSLDVSGISNHLGAWGNVPATVMQVLGALGLGTAFSIIAAALTIRFFLQLIPFVRLGS